MNEEEARKITDNEAKEKKDVEQSRSVSEKGWIKMEEYEEHV